MAKTDAATATIALSLLIHLDAILHAACGQCEKIAGPSHRDWRRCKCEEKCCQSRLQLDEPAGFVSEVGEVQICILALRNAS